MIGNYLQYSNADFIDELYQMWQNDAASVEPGWAAYFSRLSNGELDAALEGLGTPDPHDAHGDSPVASAHPLTGRSQSVQEGIGNVPLDLADPQTSARHNAAADALVLPDRESVAYKQSRVNAMVWAFRDIGYLYAELNPLKGYLTPDMWYMKFAVEGNYESLSLEEFGLCDADLELQFNAGRFLNDQYMKLRDLLEHMRRVYCGTLGSEVLHIQNNAVRNWLLAKLENPSTFEPLESHQRIRLQKDLIRAEEFEHFIHGNFIGQKRFSLEGGEALIPGLRHLFDLMLAGGVEESIVGMAHRGRLNVFVNAMNRPAVDIFSRFIDNYAPHTYGGSGDVKYHLGFSVDYRHSEEGPSLHIGLVANPSHLEAVNPVVEGKARGVQRRRKDRHRKKVVPVLIHGDSAFSGQGVVSETLNLSQLKGYRTGGTIHIIVNNQIGFTTASQDSRSTFFASDAAKTISVPIFHVNGDDPESVHRAMALAFKFRQKFGHDVIVDLICYRRLGHNEADEPSFSHPKMYKLIKNHKSARHIFGEKLIASGDWDEDGQHAFAEQYRQELKSHLDRAKADYKPVMDDAFHGDVWKNFQRRYSFEPVPTGVSRERLEHMARVLTTIPDDFHVHPKLLRFTSGRKEQFETDAIDWGFAEALAFGSLLTEGHQIRLSGEDCRRGTFSHRHAVWWDTESAVPRSYAPLRFLQDEQAWFSVYDSPLSEFSVLGFDYGYSLATPNNLTIWEAQFGDFVNGAQVIIDQFISSSETKWFRSSGLVMLLPHGYEGQGPEHSSAFYERFLSLCADDNMQVINPSTPAQFFHVLRRQMKQKYRKPLIIMSPKSLLRLKDCHSAVAELENGHFQTVIGDGTAFSSARKVLLCSGKMYYDLVARRSEMNIDDVAIIRLEQVYPFPAEELRRVIGQFAKAKQLCWVQEETENRGAWMFVHYRKHQFVPVGLDLSYIGRAPSPSPATGSHKQHVQELEQILEQAFS